MIFLILVFIELIVILKDMEMRGDGWVDCKVGGPTQAGGSGVRQGDPSLGSGIAHDAIVPRRMIDKSAAWRSGPATVAAEEEAVAAV